MYYKKFILFWILILALSILALLKLGVFPREELSAFLSAYFKAPESSYTKDVLPPGKLIAEGARIRIPAVGVDAGIIFPENSRPEVLNQSLSMGVVHYPVSALPGEPGTMLLFGHSSFLPGVKNPAYQVFNRLQELKPGEEIEIQAGGYGYLYKVRSIQVERADDAKIELGLSQRLLILSTCKIFGGKELRWVVEAEFAGEYPLANDSPADTSS